MVNKFDANNPIGTRKSIFVNRKWLNIKDLHFRNCFTEKHVFLTTQKMQVLDNKALAFLSISKYENYSHSKAPWAAARRAIGTRKGEQLA